jgi:hypothetical protein
VIGFFVFIGYTAIALAVARYSYVRLRTAEIEDNERSNQRYPNSPRTEYGVEPTLFNGWLALMIGAFWPLGVLILAITADPPKSPIETRAEAQAREEYIRELERELGMKETR